VIGVVLPAQTRMVRAGAAADADELDDADGCGGALHALKRVARAKAPAAIATTALRFIGSAPGLGGALSPLAAHGMTLLEVA